ncbi:bifunctional diguanylate cyclase/phosphodiesterase [Sansalvadorimonas sp. 2012CJ34-2]|uniref:Bifunctional diguanylate cyclase/phosphodiesterase n=1 Tax=Parendozoicomonas callyspongiae TaxID=2942213 RepID=A0ABT0PGF0_9GAMM|nr:bifunctional diguanylate cyclase/phosphodiesterase [Sansalvadorimonas sp. 2012CJ34-2]MCL6270462.1 bifunctional diguanylate cyclase/phosphodiesterase [Sansalvadorimonas sp. 2012CJ34-2]
MDWFRKLLNGDGLVLMMVVTIGYLLSVEFNAFEQFYLFASSHKELSLDKLLTFLFIVLWVLLLYGVKRWVDLAKGQDELNETNAKLQKTLEDVEEIAVHDMLTGLLNRRGFTEALQDSIARARREKGKTAVLLVDVDRFKVINDSLGRNAGDTLLKEVAERFKNQIRQTDYIARLGADEFAIILNHIADYADSSKVAQNILDTFKTPLDSPTNDQVMTCSIGISVAPQDETDPSELLQYADLAMYQAKAGGGNRYNFYTKVLQAEVLNSLNMERDLRRAIQCDELEPYFQPQYDLAKMELIGFEALVRWKHPTRGLLPPVEFIDLAEKTHMIVEIGYVVFERACAQLEQMQQHTKSSLAMSINMSPRQLEDEDLIEKLTSIMDRYNTNPGNLLLEITENVVMSKTAKTLEVLNSIKALGIQIALDDFGTGYSSISYLQEFPFDQIKIDRQFIVNSHQNETDVRLVKLIVGMAETLGLEAVAEGIDNIEQLSKLQELDCSLGQGYLFSKPVTGWEAMKLVTGEKKIEDLDLMQPHERLMHAPEVTKTEKNKSKEDNSPEESAEATREESPES